MDKSAMAQSFASCRFDFRIDSKNGLVPSFPRYSPLRRVAGRSTKAFTCGICKAEFKLRSRLMDHKKTVHELRLDLRPIHIAPNTSASDFEHTRGNGSQSAQESRADHVASVRREQDTLNKNNTRCLLCGVDCGSPDKILDHFVAVHQVVPKVNQMEQRLTPINEAAAKMPVRRGRRPGSHVAKPSKPQLVSVEHMLVSEEGFMVNATRRRGRPPKLKLKSLASYSSSPDTTKTTPATVTGTVTGTTRSPPIFQKEVMGVEKEPVEPVVSNVNQVGFTQVSEHNPIQFGTIVNIPMFIQSSLPQLQISDLQNMQQIGIMANPIQPLNALNTPGPSAEQEVTPTGGSKSGCPSPVKLHEDAEMDLKTCEDETDNMMDNCDNENDVTESKVFTNASAPMGIINDGNTLSISSIVNHSINMTYHQENLECENSHVENKTVESSDPQIGSDLNQDSANSSAQEACSFILDEDSVNIFSCDRCDFLCEDEKEYHDHVNKVHSPSKKVKRAGYLKQTVDRLWQRKQIVSLEPMETAKSYSDAGNDSRCQSEQDSRGTSDSEVTRQNSTESHDSNANTLTNETESSIVKSNDNTSLNCKTNMASMTVTFHTCKICKQLFDKPHKLWEHRAKHKDYYKQFCDDCEFRCDSKAEMNEHHAKYHSGLESLQCVECNEIFSRWSDTLNHMLEMHKNRPIYTCQHCGKQYQSMHGLERHKQANHVENLPKIPCNYKGCGSLCSGPKALKLHYNRTHARVRRFKCPHQDCEKRFSSSYSLHNHMLVHMGKKAITCTYQGCDKHFRTMKHLRVHMLRHTDERPLKCTLCSYSCRQRTSMNWHMNSTHGYKKSKVFNFRRHRTVYVPSGSGAEVSKMKTTIQNTPFEHDSDEVQSEPMDLSLSKSSMKTDKMCDFVDDRSVQSASDHSEQSDQVDGTTQISLAGMNMNNSTGEPTCTFTLKEQAVHDRLPHCGEESTFHHFRLVKSSQKPSNAVDLSKVSFGSFITCRNCGKLFSPNDESILKRHQKDSTDIQAKYEFLCVQCCVMQERSSKAHLQYESDTEKNRNVSSDTDIQQEESAQRRVCVSDPDNVNVDTDCSEQSVADCVSDRADDQKQNPAVPQHTESTSSEPQPPVSEIYMGTRNRTRQMSSAKEDENTFQCDFIGCSKSFRLARHLHVHQLTHLECQTLNCNLCEYSCRQRNSLTWHMKSKHNCVVRKTRDKRIIYVQ